MNLQERGLLDQFLKQLTEAKISAKDDEAETMIREATGKQPDAIYLLVQRALLLEHALGVSKARNEELQAQVQNLQAGQKNSFLDDNPWAQPSSGVNTAQGGSNRQHSQQTTQPLPNSSLFGGGSTFLGNMATTAAGVVAGSFLFQGIENLMGHHSSGFGGQSFLEDQIPDTTVINNYYGDTENPALANNGNNDYQQANYAVAEDDTDSDFDSNNDDSGWA